jgi:hypothetical protein
MSARVRVRRAVLAAAIAIAWLPMPATRAEVGVSVPGGSSSLAVSLYVYGIIDDPDPVPSAWHVLTPPTPGRLVLNPLGDANGDGAPSSVVDPASGLLLVAWAKNTPTGFDIVISRFADGVWSSPQVVVGNPSASEKDPSLVLGPDGFIHVFYWVDGATAQVFETHAPSDLSSWSTPVLISDSAKPSCRPAGGVIDGVLRVAYEVHDFGYQNSPRQVVLARQDGSGFVPEVVALTNNLGDVWPQVHSQSGKVWVDWIDAENNGSGEIAWTRVDAQGHWDPLHYEPFASPGEREFLVHAAVKLKALR